MRSIECPNRNAATENSIGSFGIVPANRGVVARGPYTFVRHPIYAGYLLTHAAFLMAYPRPWNVLILLTADAALIGRALMEERVLGAGLPTAEALTVG